MWIIIDILAGIGFLTVLGLVWVAFELFRSAQDEKKELENLPPHMCYITKEECTRQWCTGCLVIEEEEKKRWAKK